MVRPGLAGRGMEQLKQLNRASETERETMKNITIKVEGVSPLLMNAFTDEAAEQATRGNKGSATGDRGTPREQAEAVLYKNERGQIGIPQPNMFTCLVEGGKFFKIGRSKVTTQRSSLIPAVMLIREPFIPLQHEEPWDVDTRPVRIPATGGRILRYRPSFEKWGLEFHVELDDELLGLKLFRDIADAAGKRVGLGDFRPDTKGPFGKFVVTHWEVE